MSILRNNLVRLGALLALAFVLASAWLSWTDDLAAQQAGKQQAEKPAEQPKFEIPAADAAIMRALDSSLRIDFKGTPMKEVLEYLEDYVVDHKLGRLNFILDEAGLKEAGIMDPGPTFYNDQITKQYKKLKIRALLHLLLAERGMAYYIEEGTVYLTKDTKVATRKLVVKNYPVANLVGGEALVKTAIAELQLQAAAKTDSGLIRLIRDLIPQPRGLPAGGFYTPMFSQEPFQLGPNGELLTRNIDGLTNQIKGTIVPDHWQGPANGPGSMAFVPASASLQVLCSLEVHYLLMMSGILDNRKSVPTEAELKTVTVKIHSLAGLLDPKNLERSKGDLEKALMILGVQSDKKGKKAAEATSIAILVDTELLIAKQPLEVQLQIESTLQAMRGMSKLNHPAPRAGVSAGPLPSNLGGITFGNNGGNGTVTSSGGVFGSSMGVFGSPGLGSAPPPPTGLENFLGK